jgi:hypothetical protein
VRTNAKISWSGKLRGKILRIVALVMLSCVFVVVSSQKAHAILGCDDCYIEGVCGFYDCPIARELLRLSHKLGEEFMFNRIREEFLDHTDWMFTRHNFGFFQEVLFFGRDIDSFFGDLFAPAIMRMSTLMSAMGMQQMFIVGSMMDAKHQLETQRLFEELQVQANRDYHPSEDFCWFGTNTRSLAASEQSGRYNMMAMHARQFTRDLGKEGSVSSENKDRAARWERFAENYCDPQDNNWRPDSPGSGLRLACGAGGGNTKRINLDVNYTRAIEEPRTIDVRFSETGATPRPGEEDVMALGDNLYGHKPLSRNIDEEYLRQQPYQHLYLALRSVAAKRSVAQSSYNAIVGMKSSGGGSLNSVEQSRTRDYLAAILTELGVPPDEAFEILGEEPSYYAQLEILAKKIYQNTDFYANLYDKPANVARKSVALKAIELMLDRAIFESELRQEMATSVLLSSSLRGTTEKINSALSGEKKGP